MSLMLTRMTVSPKAFQGLLDLYPGAAAAYSLRALSARWLVQPVVRVRRSSDNDEQDFTARDIINGNLAAWVGAGNDGFVRTWYDQSGNERDAEQAMAGNQPQIVDDGALTLENSLPSVKYNGTSSFFRADGEDVFGTLEQMVFIVNKWDGGGGGSDGRRFLMEAAIGNANVPNAIRIGFTYMRSGSPVNFNLFTHNAGPLSTPSVGFENEFNLLVSESKQSVVRAIRKNGYEIASDVPTVNFATGYDNLKIGTYRAANNRWFSGTMSEILIYPSYNTLLRNKVETNINNYWQVF